MGFFRKTFKRFFFLRELQVKIRELEERNSSVALRLNQSINFGILLLKLATIVQKLYQFELKIIKKNYKLTLNIFLILYFIPKFSLSRNCTNLF